MAFETFETVEISGPEQIFSQPGWMIINPSKDQVLRMAQVWYDHIGCMEFKSDRNSKDGVTYDWSPFGWGEAPFHTLEGIRTLAQKGMVALILGGIHGDSIAVLAKHYGSRFPNLQCGWWFPRGGRGNCWGSVVQAYLHPLKVGASLPASHMKGGSYYESA